jgi:hypothetical protein
MPIHYAIRKERTEPLTRAEQAKLYAHGYSAYEARCVFEDVPHIVADMDAENGMYALFSEHGTKLSDWMLMKKHPEVEEALILGRKKTGAPLTDSVGQTIKQGDYLFTHSNDHKYLLLNQVVRNLKTKVILEELRGLHSWFKTSGLITRNPKTFIKISSTVVEGGGDMPDVWEKQFAVREVGSTPNGSAVERYVRATESIAQGEEHGCFAYFNAEGALVSGWINIIPSKWELPELEAKVHAKKKLYDVPPAPMKDALGAEMQLGDVVFSNDNHYNNFMVCEVIGFSKDRVRLIGYEPNGRSLRGRRVITLNCPANIVKLPIIVAAV